jgi:hypothetical protein
MTGHNSQLNNQLNRVHRLQHHINVQRRSKDNRQALIHIGPANQSMCPVKQHGLVYDIHRRCCVLTRHDF